MLSRTNFHKILLAGHGFNYVAIFGQNYCNYSFYLNYTNMEILMCQTLLLSC
jgi:hypothetical protein